MAHASFGTPWPNCKPGNMVTIVRKDGLRLPVHRSLVGLTILLCDLTEMMGYDLVPGWCWGFACRNISGTNKPSNHSTGTSDDLNAPNNPYASAEWHRRNARGTKPFGLQIVCDIPERVLALWEDHGYRLGARYESKPDPMHVEFMGTTTDAARYEARLRAFLNGAPPAPPLPKEDEMIDYEKIRETVRAEVEAALNERGLTGGDDGGAGGEIRRNLRKTAAAAGVPADQIEK